MVIISSAVGQFLWSLGASFCFLIFTLIRTVGRVLESILVFSYQIRKI